MEPEPTIDISDIKKAISKNELKESIDLLFVKTKQIGNANLYNQVVLQSARFKEYAESKNMGTVDYDDLTRTRSNITLGLLGITNALPKEEGAMPSKKKWGVSEQSLKKQVFYLLVVGKMVLLLVLFTFWMTGSGFTFQGFLGVLGVVFPVLATYLGITFQDVLDNRYKQSDDVSTFRVNRSVQSVTYFFFIAYYFAIIGALYLHATGFIPDEGLINNDGYPDYKNLFTALALIETVLGGYIGILIATLFKANQNKTS